MSVTDQTTYIEYTGNNSTTTPYTITFAFEDDEDIKCWVDGVSYTTFTVSGSTLTTTTAVGTSSTLRIERDTPNTQELDLVANGDLSSTLLEGELDRIVYQVAEVRDKLDRALMVSRAATETNPAEVDATTSHYLYVDDSGDLQRRTAAQIASDVTPELTLSAVSGTKTTATWADAAARAALAPDFSGQLGVQLDDYSVWAANGTSAGNWEQIGNAHATYADMTALNAGTPEYIGQLAQVTRGGSWFRAYGTTSGDWDWVSFGTFTPATSSSWTASTTYSEGDVVTVADDNAITAGTALAGGASTIDLAVAASSSDDVYNECWVTLTAGTGAGQSRQIKDYVGSTRQATVYAAWATNPDATSEYNIDWIGGAAEWERNDAADNNAATFAEELANGMWDTYLVEDYHYTTHVPGDGGSDASTGDPVVIRLGPGNRANEWGYITDEVWQLLDARTGTINKWNKANVHGVLEFGEGTYDFDKPLKWYPHSTIRGIEGAHWPRRTVIRASSTFDPRHEYLVEGAYSNNSSAIANFWTRLQGVMIDCNAGTPSTETAAAYTTTSVTLAAGSSSDDDAYIGALIEIVSGTTGTGQYKLVTAYNGTTKVATTTDWSNGSYDALSGTVTYRLWTGCHNGIWAALSHGGRIEDVEIDNFANVGIRVVGSSDSWSAARVSMSALGSGTAAHAGWWFESGALAFDMQQLNINRCRSAMSFGTARGAHIVGLETENCGYAIDFREATHPDMYGDGSTSNGVPEGCTFLGCSFRRDDADPVVPSTADAVFLRWNQSHQADCVIQGTCSAASTNTYQNARVVYQAGTEYTYPLRFDGLLSGSDLTENYNFRIDLGVLVRSLYLRSDNTTTTDTRLTAANNPATYTADTGAHGSGDTIDLAAGIYRVELPASNTYGGGTITLYDSVNGDPVCGINGYSAVSTELEALLFHSGGEVEVVIAGSTTPSIDIYFRPTLVPGLPTATEIL